MDQQITEQVQPIIENLQNQIWEAEYFISINANAVYWQGRKDSNEFALNGFRAIGISVSEIINKMRKPNFSQLHGES